jgi:tRNA(fMet)-specific endonuclease VapC
MGLVVDTTILIAAERKRFDLPRFFLEHQGESFFIAAITVAELFHGVERANTADRKEQRLRFVEAKLAEFETIEFDVAVARRHARVWAAQEAAGQPVGAHDLMIAATALHYDHKLVTLNLADFRRIPPLRLADPSSYRMN